MTNFTVACAVCFGAVEPIIRESVTSGILVLLGVTTVVLGCFARFIVVLAKRARAAGDAVDVLVRERTV